VSAPPDPAGYRPWPRDDQGRLLAAAPIRGLCVEVHLGGHGAQFDRWRVAACSSRRFVVRDAGRSEVHPASAWGDWLDARAAEGPLTAHLPGCVRSWCRGCDTAGVGRPGLPLASPARAPGARPSPAAPAPAPARPSPGAPVPVTDLGARDVRVLRAARDVLASYTFHPLPPTGPADHRVRVEVRGGGRPYEVAVDPAWGDDPRCTCADHARAANGGFCKHVIGVLLRDDALRCQLLELFL
jgi:hypothetical protein